MTALQSAFQWEFLTLYNDDMKYRPWFGFVATGRTQDRVSVVSPLSCVCLVLQHMRNVAERRQQLEVEHKEALLVLQEKQEEVRRLQQVCGVFPL